eukprot:1314785-Pyramimonas_sp.AAC.1
MERTHKHRARGPKSYYCVDDKLRNHKRGPRGRLYNRVPATRATAGEWTEKFHRAGVAGGAEAQLFVRGEEPEITAGFWRLPLVEDSGRGAQHKPSHLEWINPNEEEPLDYGEIHHDSLFT